MARGVVIPPSFYEAIRDLEPGNRLTILEAVLEYGLYGAMPELPPALKGFFLLMQPVIDSSQRRYAASIENGKKGGAPKGNQNAGRRKQPDGQPENNQTNNQTNNHDLDSDSEIDLDSDLRLGEGDARGGTGHGPVPLADHQQREADSAKYRDDWIRQLEQYGR